MRQIFRGPLEAGLLRGAPVTEHLLLVVRGGAAGAAAGQVPLQPAVHEARQLVSVYTAPYSGVVSRCRVQYNTWEDGCRAGSPPPASPPATPQCNTLIRVATRCYLHYEVGQSEGSLHLPGALQDPINPFRALVVYTASTHRLAELLYTTVHCKTSYLCTVVSELHILFFYTNDH